MQVTFVKEGYDPFIDFIKAYAIICVLIGHTFPMSDIWGYLLWAGMQVPLFVLIQTFHFYKRDSNLNIKKLLKRIVLPFVIVSCLTFLIQLAMEDVFVKTLIIRGIGNGGGTDLGAITL